jgi:xyloglucan fucosyltransferase
MEMTTSGAGGVTKLDDDDYPSAAPADRCPPGTEKKMCRRVLLVGSLVTLPLLAFFVFSRENASVAWLQVAIAQLTATNDDDGAAGTYGHLLFPCMSFACSDA